MASLYNQMNPGATSPAAGTPGYQQEIVQNTATALKPQYNQAVLQARQGMANRGMLRGGLENQAEGDIGNQYRANLNQVGNEAAVHGADLAEQERVRQEQRGWQTADINQALEQRRQELAQQQQQQNNAQWASLIGMGVGAVGNVAGSYLGGRAARSSAQQPNYDPSAPADAEGVPTY